MVIVKEVFTVLGASLAFWTFFSNKIAKRPQWRITEPFDAGVPLIQEIANLRLAIVFNQSLTVHNGSSQTQNIDDVSGDAHFKTKSLIPVPFSYVSTVPPCPLSVSPHKSIGVKIEARIAVATLPIDPVGNDLYYNFYLFDSNNIRIIAKSGTISIR